MITIKLEVKINVINQLKLFKNFTFKDLYTFIDENIQNAQRAKAKNAYVTVDIDEITFFNDGMVLNDFQKLFSIAESGWEDKDVKKENPFGIGFFSNVCAADHIKVMSGNKYTEFSINEMIEKEDCNLETKESNDYIEGFKLILSNINSELNMSEVEERVKKLGAYTTDLNVYLNDKLQDKADLTKPDEGYELYKTISNDECIGWVAARKSYFNNDIEIFYKGRSVTTINCPYITGKLYIEDGVLSLTAPDRKSIIKNNQYNDFVNAIEGILQEFASDTYLNRKNLDVKIVSYSDFFNYYLSEEDIIENTSFKIFKGKKQIDYVKDFSEARFKNTDIRDFEDYDYYLNQDSAEQNENIVGDEIIIESGEVSYQRNYASYGYGGATYSTHIDSEEVYNNHKENIKISDIKTTTIWVKTDEIYKYDNKFKLLKAYNMNLIVCQDPIQEKALKYLSQPYNNPKGNFFHISDLNEKVTYENTLSNTQLSQCEKRGLMLFDLISKIFCKNHNIFAIGDVMSVKKIAIEGTSIHHEYVDDTVSMVKDRDNDKIYVDRNLIDFSYLDPVMISDKLNIYDVKFIMCNMLEIKKALITMVDDNNNDCIEDRLYKSISGMIK